MSDRLFDLLLRGGVIRLTERHVICNADILAKRHIVSGTILILIPLMNTYRLVDQQQPIDSM
jgi:hypothetical protein